MNVTPVNTLTPVESILARIFTHPRGDQNDCHSEINKLRSLKQCFENTTYDDFIEDARDSREFLGFILCSFLYSLEPKVDCFEQVDNEKLEDVVKQCLDARSVDQVTLNKLRRESRTVAEVLLEVIWIAHCHCDLKLLPFSRPTPDGSCLPIEFTRAVVHQVDVQLDVDASGETETVLKLDTKKRYFGWVKVTDWDKWSQTPREIQSDSDLLVSYACYLDFLRRTDAQVVWGYKRANSGGHPAWINLVKCGEQGCETASTTAFANAVHRYHHTHSSKTESEVCSEYRHKIVSTFAIGTHDPLDSNARDVYAAYVTFVLSGCEDCHIEKLAKEIHDRNASIRLIAMRSLADGLVGQAVDLYDQETHYANNYRRARDSLYNVLASFRQMTASTHLLNMIISPSSRVLRHRSHDIAGLFRSGVFRFGPHSFVFDHRHGGAEQRDLILLELLDGPEKINEFDRYNHVDQWKREIREHIRKTLGTGSSSSSGDDYPGYLCHLFMPRLMGLDLYEDSSAIVMSFNRLKLVCNEPFKNGEKQDWTYIGLASAFPLDAWSDDTKKLLGATTPEGAFKSRSPFERMIDLYSFFDEVRSLYGSKGGVEIKWCSDIETGNKSFPNDPDCVAKITFWLSGSSLDDDSIDIWKISDGKLFGAIQEVAVNLQSKTHRNTDTDHAGDYKGCIRRFLMQWLPVRSEKSLCSNGEKTLSAPLYDGEITLSVRALGRNDYTSGKSIDICRSRYLGTHAEPVVSESSIIFETPNDENQRSSDDLCARTILFKITRRHPE